LVNAAAAFAASLEVGKSIVTTELDDQKKSEKECHSEHFSPI
jgi:hypothetical protein